MKEAQDSLQREITFSLLTLKDSYFQIQIKEEDKKKKALKINKEFMNSKVSKGHKTVPLIYQRMMNLRNGLEKQC